MPTTATKSPAFSRLEAELITHRLDIPECIWEVYESDDWSETRGGNCYSMEEIEAACISVGVRLISGNWSDLSGCEFDVLRESAEGSTWAGTARSQGLSDQKMAGVRRVARSVAKKVSEILGITVDCPES